MDKRERVTIFISAGEASGDLHGAALASALQELCPGVRLIGIGGDRMAEAGVELLVHNQELAVVGLVEVVSHIVPIAKAFKRATAFIRKKRPDLLILIDFPDFNFLLGRRAKSHGVPVFYYICPQLWAWRQGRVEQLKRFADALAVILPFEEEFYRQRGLDTRFVGHPLLDSVKPSLGRKEFMDQLRIPLSKRIISLLPGSRRGEIQRHLPVMLEAAMLIRAELTDIDFLLPLLKPQDIQPIPQEIQKRIQDLSIKIVTGQTWNALNASDFAIAASGTVTIEAAIMGTPMLVTYRVSPLTYHLGKRLIKVKYASLVNLIAQKEVVPELLQDRATPENIASTSISILSSPQRLREMESALAEVIKALGARGAAQNAARMALDLAIRRRIQRFST